MNILISGSSGLVGSALVIELRRNAHQIRRLVRDPSERGESAVVWNPQSGEIREPDQLRNIDAVIHLAGAPIIGRWTRAKKAEIRNSRVQGTRTLARAIAGMDSKPSVLLSASGIDYYGNRGDETLTEQSDPGTGFLADVCKEWEAATAPAEDAGVRVVHMRFGMVLSPDGGALGAMLTPFRLGLGGRIGSGQQFMSWISIQDLCGVVHFLLEQDQLSGPVNVVSPTPVTNREFTKSLGQALSRPTLFPVPAFAARLVLGELADTLLLAGHRIIPERLQLAGYAYRHEKLEQALSELL